MEAKEIIEGNELIALFMGAFIMSSSTTAEGVKTINSLSIDDRASSIPSYDFATKLKYHSSYDWIMPVIEKIEALGYDIQIAKGYTDVMFYYFGAKQMGHQLACGEGKSKLENTWSAVVDFIRWYNLNRKEAKQ